MRTPEQMIELLDYRQEKASDAFVPKPAALSSSGWDSIYFELHQQPKFETIEHQHTIQAIAYGVSGSSKLLARLNCLSTFLVKEKDAH